MEGQGQGSGSEGPRVRPVDHRDGSITLRWNGGNARLVVGSFVVLCGGGLAVFSSGGVVRHSGVADSTVYFPPTPGRLRLGREGIFPGKAKALGYQPDFVMGLDVRLKPGPISETRTTAKAKYRGPSAAAASAPPPVEMTCVWVAQVAGRGPWEAGSCVLKQRSLSAPS
jgi:hypothetical protein